MPGTEICPVAQAAEVFTERWTPLVIRELAPTSSRPFSDLPTSQPRFSASL